MSTSGETSPGIPAGGSSGAVPTERAGRRQWAGLALLTGSALLITVDFSVLNLAVPAITADLRPGSAELLWIVDVYGFLLAGFLVPMGALGDRFGRRRLLLAGAAAFGLASVLAATAGSAGTLIAARALMGVAGAALAPSTLSLISAMFPHPRQRTVAISVWGAALSVGGALGPLVGGVMLARFWWGSVFLLALPVMAVLLIVGPRLLPEYRNPAAGRVDLTSVVLSLLAVLAVVYGLQQAAQDGPSAGPIVTVLVGTGAGALFLRRQRRLTRPLIDLALFRIPVVGLGLVANTLSFFVILGMFLLTGQYLQLVLGLSPLAAGLWSVPSMAALVLGDLATPRLIARFRPMSVLTGGLVVAAAGCAVLATVSTGTGVGPAVGLTVIVVGTTVLSLGVAPVSTLVADLVVGSVPTNRAGAAAALSETTTELGGALGIAVLGSIATVIYRAGTAVLAPALPPEDAAATRDSLGGATDAAHTLPATLAHDVLTAARTAFSAGLSTVAVVAAALLVVLALAALLLARATSQRGTSPEANDITATTPAAVVPARTPATVSSGLIVCSPARPYTDHQGAIDMLLQDKTAIVYGAGGAIGSAVARALAREGAQVFLTGRTREPLDTIARLISQTGGHAEAAVVDAQDASAVAAHAATVAERTGRIDVAFNATSNDDIQGTPLVDLPFEDFLRPITKAATTQYVIATEVARHMISRRSGAILAMAGGREAIPELGGSHVAWSALAGLCRQLAAELGPHGIRVAWVLSPGSPNDDDQEASQGDDDAAAGLLRRRPSLATVANVAAFLASDWASTMTATEVNITSGAVID